MVQLPADLPFEAWLDYLFGRPIGPSGFRESDDWWDEAAAPERAVDYLTRLFEQPEVLLDRYPRRQIDRGFWYLVGESGHLGPLLDGPVAWEARRRGLLAIGGLFGRLFAPVCTDHLGHLDRGPQPPDPLNSICYMWWDLFPTWGAPDADRTERPADWGRSRRARRRDRRGSPAEGPPLDPAEQALRSVDRTLLHVLTRTLRLESEPCREAALHGLGHWHLRYPEQAAAIIRDWLAGRPAISPELHRYALQAATGCVL